MKSFDNRHTVLQRKKGSLSEIHPPNLSRIRKEPFVTPSILASNQTIPEQLDNSQPPQLLIQSIATPDISHFVKKQSTSNLR